MRFSCLTLFPESMQATLSDSIIGRAEKNGLIEIDYINIRDFASNKHNRVDDSPYGGGAGMVMQAPPVYDAYMSVLKMSEKKPHVVYMSPQGSVFSQKKAAELSNYEHVVLLCGHYEGIDERVLEEIVDEEISIGDYVLTGGELAAMVVIDAVSRLVPGVLGCDESSVEESHMGGLLEYPQYTRPPEFMGKTVPEVLLSGHHENIKKWRKEQALIRTYKKRPDMFKKYKTDDKKELKFIKENGLE